MRKCMYQYLNDCNCFQDDGPRPCCLECDEYEVCPEKCRKSETTFCIGLIEKSDNDNDPVSKTIPNSTP